MVTFYLSFADPEKPAGAQWLGAVLAEAEDFGEAVQITWQKGCNPGGEVNGWIIDQPPSEQWFYRLLDKKDLYEMGVEIVKKYNLDKSENRLVNAEGTDVEWGFETH